MDSGNTAWVLVSAALVLFMTPGLAFFYGGMVRSKNVLGMLMQNVFWMGLGSVLGAVVVFGLAVGQDGGGIERRQRGKGASVVLQAKRAKRPGQRSAIVYGGTFITIQRFEAWTCRRKTP